MQYTLDPENYLTQTFLLLSILLVMSYPWTWLIMLSPNTKTFLMSLVFVFLLAFLISSLLGLSVDATTFVDLSCRLFLEWIVRNLSQVFSLLTYTTLVKNSLQPLFLGELGFGFPFDDSVIGATTECKH